MNLIFRDPEDLRDLNAFLTRAKRLDEDGLVKLKTFGEVLAVYVAPLFSGNLLESGPTVLGLRTIQLAEPASVDAAFELAAILDRIPQAQANLELAVPPTTFRAAWTGITPPRSDWQFVEQISQPSITAWAKAGIAEVADTLPDSIGSAIAQKARLSIWGKSVGVSELFPAGCAFALAGLGFMQPGEDVSVFRTRGWGRLSTPSGHVIARSVN